jgi:hypothetical protein
MHETAHFLSYMPAIVILISLLGSSRERTVTKTMREVVLVYMTAGRRVERSGLEEEGFS